MLSGLVAFLVAKMLIPVYLRVSQLTINAGFSPSERAGVAGRGGTLYCAGIDARALLGEKMIFMHLRPALIAIVSNAQRKFPGG